MKKIIIITLAFSFLFSGIVQGLSEQPERTTGRQQAMERIEESIRRIEDMNPDFDSQRLRRALESIMATEEEFCHYFEENLEYEDEGDEVKNLQKALNKAGHFQSEISGVYDWDLAKAVYEFQNENDIELDGVAKFGFAFEEKAREVLNDKFDCGVDEGEEVEEEIAGIVREGEEGECGWVSTNSCPENAGANWECVNEKETELDRPDDVVCPQVISPKPTSSCKSVEGVCEGEANRGEGLEVR